MDNIDTNNSGYQEAPSGASTKPAQQLAHEHAVLQPIHNDIIPEDTTATEQNVNEEPATSLSYHVGDEEKYKSTNDAGSAYKAPSYQRQAVQRKQKPLIGVYILAFIIIVNSIYGFLASSKTSSDATNLIRLLSSIGLLMGIGLIIKSNIARVLTTALYLFLAVLSITSFNPMRIGLYAGILIYLNLPHVKEVFED
jgi:hypothetical protein